MHAFRTRFGLLAPIIARAALLQAGAVKPQTSLRPRDPNATAAALRSKVSASSRPAGVSLSSLLQTRAESAAPKVAAGGVPQSPLPDIDSADLANPLAAAEYANSIYNYFRRVEPKFRVAHDYMKSQVSSVQPANCRMGVGPGRKQGGERGGGKAACWMTVWCKDNRLAAGACRAA